MSADHYVTQALRDDVCWHLDQHHGDLVGPDVARALAAEITEALRCSYVFGGGAAPREGEPDQVAAVVEAGMLVANGLTITPEVALERASNITQAFVGLFDCDFSDDDDGDTDPVNMACIRPIEKEAPR